MSERTVHKFLHAVWSKQPGWPDATPFLSAKDWQSGKWEDYPQAGSSVIIPTIDDLYFAPVLFTRARRLRDSAHPSRWLYADLDEVVPDTIDPRLRPTIAWETSPGRFQCMWLLERPLRPEQHEALNQRMTYYVGADKGGWSATKVLRVPGSRSTKHGSPFVVHLVEVGGARYAASDLYDIVKESVPSVGRSGQGRVGQLPNLPKVGSDRLYKRHRAKLTIEARRLLREDVAVGGRSEALWKLIRLLLEAGIPEPQVFVMAKAAPCNKYAGQRREDQQIWTEIQKATSRSGMTTPKESSPRSKNQRSASITGSKSRRDSSSPKEGTTRRTSKASQSRPVRRSLTSYSEFVAKPIRKPSWMVEGIWSESAHGVVAGDPKTFKSVISTDLAVSVASGTRFLDHFPVPQQGPVILIQKENDEGEVQDRFQRIAYSKRLGADLKIRRNVLSYTPDKDLPIHLMNNEDFDLTDEGDMRWLRKQVRRLNPVLLILDPFYLLAPGVDENSAAQVSPVMERLLRLKQRTNCGTLIIHHFKKQSAEHPVQGAPRISGSGVFHRWYESALLLDRPDLAEPEVRITPEHRSHGPQGVIWASFDLGTYEDLHYSVDIRRPREQAAHEYATIRELVESAGGNVAMKQVMEALGVSKHKAQRRIEAAGLQTELKRTRNGRALYVIDGNKQNGKTG